MTEQKTRKGRGGKLSRSETVTVRLDPQTKEAAAAMAAMHRRTLSSYIEMCLLRCIKQDQGSIDRLAQLARETALSLPVVGTVSSGNWE